jgi:ATP-binding cassette subfamily A (ABC1) protein 2
MRSPFAWDLITRNLIAMLCSGLAFFIITLLCEYNVFRLLGCKRKDRHQSYRTAAHVDEDQDVAHERLRVLSTGNDPQNVLRMRELTKVFKKPQKHMAVNGLCLDVTRGECFGLLGVNGAGKSTTFKMLTGDIPVTSGDAIINQFSVREDLHRAQQNIGYCPQFDALFDELTAREHLKFYARLRGVKDEELAIETVLRRVELTAFADKLTRDYSGGTKRKLSAAIALISAPPIVFMVWICLLNTFSLISYL